MNNNERKTQRKNNIKQSIIWPSNESYFTINSLMSLNPHIITSSGSNITLRVRLNKAISDENLVSVIGQKSVGKGRPQLVFAMRPVHKSAIENAKSDGINVMDSTKLITVMEMSIENEDNKINNNSHTESENFKNEKLEELPTTSN